MQRVREKLKEVKIKDIFELGRGRVISHHEINENLGDYPVYSSQSKNDGEMGRINSYDFDGEYITWTTDGAYAGSVFYRNGKFNCTNVCGTLKAKNNDVDMRFLAFALGREAKKHVVYCGNPKLMNNVMAEIKLSLPPLAEQKKIACILSKVDEDIEKTDEVIKKTERLKKGLMRDLFDNQKLGKEKWKQISMGEIANIVMGQSPSSESYNKEKVGLPFLQGKADFSEKSKYPFIKQWTSNPTKISKEGSLLFTVRAPVGEIFYNNVEACIGRGLASINANEENSQDFLYYFLQSKKSEFEKLSQGSTFTAINSKELKGIKVNLPSLEKQKEISETLLKVDNKIELNKKIKSKLEILKKGLMQDLLAQSL